MGRVKEEWVVSSEGEEPNGSKLYALYNGCGGPTMWFTSTDLLSGEEKFVLLRGETSVGTVSKSELPEWTTHRLNNLRETNK